MQEITVKKIDVFTTKPFCGNPAGVITNADGIAGEDMQRIAAVLNLAECCFVQSPASPDNAFRVRFFTQQVELDLSSHALIAACFGAIEDGRVRMRDGVTELRAETNIGGVPLDVYFDSSGGPPDASTMKEGVPISSANGDGGMLRRIMIHQKRDDIRRADIPVSELAGILGFDEMEIRGTGLPLEILTHGLKQLVIPVMHQETLLNLNPDLIKLNLLNKRYDIQTNDIFTLDAISPDSTVFSRTFSPAIGLWEDIGSGSGAGSIIAYSVRHGVLHPGSMIVEQGTDRSSLVRIYVDAGEYDGSSIPLRIGGLAVTSIEQAVAIDAEAVAAR